MSLLLNLHNITNELEDKDMIHKIDRLIEEISQEAKKDIEFLQLVKIALQK